MEMGQNIPYKLVDEMPANEFLNLEGKKFSKSEGWTIDLKRFFERYTPDQIRYCLAANAPEAQDSEFTWKDFQMRCNSELVGKFGNFANRTLVFAHEHCQGEVPQLSTLDAIDLAFQTRIQELANDASACYGTFHLRKASQVVMELAQAGNVYFDAKKPWVSAKSKETKASMENTIALCLDAIKVLSLISFPIIPKAASRLWKMLGFSSDLTKQTWDHVLASAIPAGQTLGQPELLFQKVEDAWIQEEIDLLQKTKATKQAGPQLGIDDVRKIDLRIAKVIASERVEKSSKLLKLRVDLGKEERTIVAGIGERIGDPSSLLGQNVVIVANLKPAKFLGIESQGMLLAISTKEGLIPLTTLPGAPGDQIS